MKTTPRVLRRALVFVVVMTSFACDEPRAPRQAPTPITLTSKDFKTLEVKLSNALRQHIKRAHQAHAPQAISAKTGAVAAMYREANGQPLWTTRSVEPLGSKGQALHQVLVDAVVKEGISPHQLGTVDLSQRLTSLTYPQLDPIKLSTAERKVVIDWLKQQPNGRRLSKHEQELARDLLRTNGPLGRLDALKTQHLAQLKTIDTKRRQVDRAMSEALLRYAQIVRFDNDAWLKHVQWPKAMALPKGQKTPSAELIKKRKKWLVESTLVKLAVAKNAKSLVNQLNQIRPHFQAYTRLMDAHARYVKLAGQGGWPEVPKALIDHKKGTHPGIEILRKRLAIEGYYKGPKAGQALDKPLLTAISLYQQTHQLHDKPYITKTMWRSINVPAHRRLMEVRLALQNWRESAVGADPYYVRVNIADFHAEVWDAQKRVWRTRVVTGAKKREYDRKQRKWVMPQQTARFSDEMKYIVFRPFWNVPKTILESELLPKQEKEPDYFEKHGFEWVEVSETHKYLRQKPGGENALGEVKFIFPNKHDIYMHDTPSKGFFERPVRAYSHGCVRVKDPMTLAKILLEKEKRWKPKQVKTWQAKPSETWVTLKSAVPVHLEYVVARVGDAGHVHFLTDVYRLNTEPLTRQMGDDRATQLAQQALGMVSTMKQPNLKKIAVK